ncbi:MAG: Modification methylase MwoI [Candidatus Heimdallarchaeota archaeon LC_2]|nr:MAG: Modification methylase MwoI [Candidatus Heimdallarchaeota archaeon LC_2]
MGEYVGKIRNEIVPNILEKLPDETINLTLTSPPFYDDKLYILEDGKIEFGWKTYNEYILHITRVFDEILRITKKGGKLILVMSNSPKISKESQIEYYWPCLHDLISIACKNGWRLVDEIVWIHEDPVYISVTPPIPETRMSPFHNWISILQRPGKLKSTTNEKISENSVWYLPSEGPFDEYNEMYGSFPNELVERCIKYWSLENDVILDPYAGSGQTIRIAKQLNRIGIGFEADTRWKHLWSDIND